MAKIKQLLPHEAQKIAAGEVVERPANIVKELLENAIDAQAQQISLYIKDGGKRLIRVIDTGCGMDYDDAERCFLKHATSKIEHINQLETISTFGFRGEALASIAAVSKVTLVTKEANTNEGTKLYLEDGQVQKKEIVSHATGTDISVTELFYNIPARKKFLKKNQTELRNVQQLFHAFCFDYPSIHFKLFSENKLIIHCPPVADLTTRCTQLWDHVTSQHILELTTQHDNGKLSISGTISNHQHYRYDRSGIFFFVNKRWVKNSNLGKALLKGYANVLPLGRFPNACITITIDPTLIDINIHPRKEEVKFLQPRRVEKLLQHAVKQTLENFVSTSIAPKHTIYQPIKNNPFNNQRPHYIPQPSQLSPPIPSPEQISYGPLSKLRQNFNKTASQTQQSFTQYEVTQTEIQPIILIGQYNKTYLIIEQTEGLFFVDQHAAHERILYELFSQRFNNVATINLIFPQIINLAAQDVIIIEPHLDLFKQNGIVVEVFGTDQLIIKSTPVHLKDVSLNDLIKQVIGWITDYNTLDKNEFLKKIHEKIHAKMACTAAVKAGDILTREHMEQLLRNLQKTENRLTCPHGRPTGWLLRLHEIEKKFKRDYKGKVL